MMTFIKSQIGQMKRYSFLFEELVKRDFKKKYKRTVLGMLWSLISPLMMLLVMSIVFTQFFGRSIPHYTIYLFCGNTVYSFFKDSTYQGMFSLVQNANVITKINLPKYMFLFSKNVASLINFGLTLIILILFILLDHVTITWRFIMLLFPILCLIIFNLGMGFILSALFVIFKDVQYLYDIFTLVLMYMSAIFYTTDAYSETVQKIFYLNPLYVYITYFRRIILDGVVPGWPTHVLCILYALVIFCAGALFYKKYNYKFLYYL